MYQAGAADRLGERVAHRRIEPRGRGLELGGGYPQVGRADAVEALGGVKNGGIAAGTHVVADRPDRVDGDVHVDRGARQQPADLRGGGRRCPQI